MPFLRGLVESETQTALIQDWTWVADSISYGDNHYTKLIIILNEYLILLFFRFAEMVLS